MRQLVANHASSWRNFNKRRPAPSLRKTQAANAERVGSYSLRQTLEQIAV